MFTTKYLPKLSVHQENWCSQPNICLRSIFTTKYLPMLNVHKKYLHPLNVHKKYLPKLNVPKETLIICSIVHNHMLTYTHCSLENICLRSMFITKYWPVLNILPDFFSSSHFNFKICACLNSWAIREGIKKNVPFSSFLLVRGGGVGGDVKNY